MSRVLSDLLEAKEPLFTMALQQLEKASGHPGADVRLIAEISVAVNQKTRELGLDTSDTTGRELYHALQALSARHDLFLATALGGRDPSDVGDLLPRIKTCLQTMQTQNNVWVIKHSVIKRLLKNQPPKKVMKQFGYKSVDSLLKREQVGEVLAATRICESTQWQKKLVKSYKTLRPSDFETRPVEIALFKPKRLGDYGVQYVLKRRHNITHLKELGVLALLPLPISHMRGVTLAVLPLALHYINEIRTYSAFFKLQQVKSRFGDVLVDTILNDPKHVANLAGKRIHWRIIQRHFGAKGKHPELFEPHVQPEDLSWQKAESVIYRLEPALKFWEGLDYVAVKQDGRPVPLGLLDNAISYCNGFEYGQQAVYHFRESLWNEIFMRYMGQQQLEEDVLMQLNNDSITPKMSVA